MKPQEARSAASRPAGLLMDTPAIMAELGVSRAQAERIIRWAHEEGLAVRPVEGTRKLYVTRSGVERWLELSCTNTERRAS